MQHLIHTKNEDNFLIQTLVSRWPWDAENPFPDHVSQAVKDAIWTYSRRRLTMLRIPTGSSQPRFDDHRNHSGRHYWLPRQLLWVPPHTPDSDTNTPLVNPAFQATAPPSPSAQQVFIKYIT